MNLTRRTFLKTSGTILASLTAARVRPVQASQAPRLLFGREVPGRCPLCSLGCGLIYRSREAGRWQVEGDPDCPIALGSLCSRGAALTAGFAGDREPRPLYRPPGAHDFREIQWNEAVHLVARRLKDLRNRDLALFSGDGEEVSNRFDSLGVIAGGALTNEEAYVTSKLFRALGVVNLDTTIRASHGMGVSGLKATLGLPGATHPVNQIAHSDVVVLVGCNPGQTAPAICRYLDRVRARRGTVIVLDPRRSETVKKDDLWLRLRPGTDNAVLGALMNWVLQYADIRKAELMENSDAAYLTLSEIMGEYERHKSGKYKNWVVVDETLQEPYSILQRMKEHFSRYDLRKVSGISGVDIDLLRRACTLLARTASPDFSASFLIGSGALAGPSGADAVRMAASIQALLGNLDKRGGGVILPTAAGNAQGACDMGLLAPYLPGYVKLPLFGKGASSPEEGKALEALLGAWYPTVAQKKAMENIPHLEEDESPSLSTVVQGVGDEQIKALLVIGADPLGSLSDNVSFRKVLDHLDLLVVLDSAPNRISRFWEQHSGNANTIKTEVFFIPTEPPVLKNGSMTDPARRVRTVRPPEAVERKSSGLLGFLGGLGNSIRSKYEVEGGILGGPVLELSWPLALTPEGVAAEINGWRRGDGGEFPLPPGSQWQKGDRCGNHLYRGWYAGSEWSADRRDADDRYGIGLFENWGWFWPWGIADPFSWIREPGSERGSYLRWKGMDIETRSAQDVLPLRPQLPVNFWKLVDRGSPFPEHYEPFHSPLSDFLTGGRSNPNMQLRKEGGDNWGYLSRRPEDILSRYPVIITIHRTGNVMGTGGITARADIARELGTDRIVEIGKEFAQSLRVGSGDRVAIHSPNNGGSVEATALVTGRIGSFVRDGALYHVASLTLYGDDGPGVNALTPSAFDFLSGGMEIKVFMGKIEKL